MITGLNGSAYPFGVFKNKACGICSNIFLPYHPAQKFCSEKCQRKSSVKHTTKWKKSNPEKSKPYQTLYEIKRKSKILGIPFNLTIDDIENYDTCPVFGFKLERGSNHDKRNSPSVDRIIPELGYVKENIQVISYKANTMKQDATPEELRMFARWVLKTFPEESDGKT